MINMKHVIISCQPRTGATWLGKLFDSHPNVRFLWEPDKKDAHKNREWTTWPFSDSKELQKRIDTFQSHQSILPYFKKHSVTHVVYKLCSAMAEVEDMDEQVRAYQRRRFVEIVGLLDSKIIHLLRHPARAVVSAQRFNIWLHSKSSCKQWLDDYKREAKHLWSRYHKDSRYHLVLFEDLVRDTPNTIRTLMCQVGLNPEFADRDFWFKCHEVDAEEKDPHKHSVFMHKSTVMDRWRTLPSWALDMANEAVSSSFLSKFYKPLVR